MDDMVLQVRFLMMEMMVKVKVLMTLWSGRGCQHLGVGRSWGKRPGLADKEDGIQDKIDKYHLISLLGDNGWQESCCRHS